MATNIFKGGYCEKKICFQWLAFLGLIKNTHKMFLRALVQKSINNGWQRILLSRKIVWKRTTTILPEMYNKSSLHDMPTMPKKDTRWRTIFKSYWRKRKRFFSWRLLHWRWSRFYGIHYLRSPRSKTKNERRKKCQIKITMLCFST